MFLRFTIAMLLGAILAALFGGLIGIVVLRLRGDYLAIVTLAFGEIVKNVINVLYLAVDGNGFHFSMKDTVSMKLTADADIIINGAKGITGTSKDTTFTVAALLLIVTYMIIANLMNSRSGRAIMAIRDNRIAAESVGIDITKLKYWHFQYLLGWQVLQVCFIPITYQHWLRHPRIWL